MNNAGVATGMATATGTTTEVLKNDLQVNVYGAVAFTLEALPLLRKGQGKKIFVTSSGMASLQLAPSMPYGAGCKSRLSGDTVGSRLS